ncbi:hypothetical protein KKB10_00500 [Patescibacteria group bacterium]|nr:hypothetical protein [Patescibacteria group bacterium]MBU1951951.1 hypothetical protein [Patescibacteria group bacterium]
MLKRSRFEPSDVLEMSTKILFIRVAHEHLGRDDSPRVFCHARKTTICVMARNKGQPNDVWGVSYSIRRPFEKPVDAGGINIELRDLSSNFLAGRVGKKNISDFILNSAPNQDVMGYWFVNTPIRAIIGHGREWHETSPGNPILMLEYARFQMALEQFAVQNRTRHDTLEKYILGVIYQRFSAFLQQRIAEQVRATGIAFS